MDTSFFSHNGSPHPSHILVAIYFSFNIFAIRFFLDKFVFRRFAVWLLCKKRGSSKIDEATRAAIVKCTESMWKLVYYATVEACVLKFAWSEPWFWDTKLFFKGWPHQDMKLQLKLVYMCQCGFYIYSIAALLVWETRRKDFAVMMSHHVITVALIGYSYISGFFRIGVIILALHDASDVFLETAKIHKYSGKDVGASVCFGLFAISWLILRLIFFPFWVIKASSYDLVGYLNLSDTYPKTVYYGFNSMLLMLLVFHIYWWVLIYAMIMRQLKNRGKVGEDIRSDSDSDSDDE